MMEKLLRPKILIPVFLSVAILAALVAFVTNPQKLGQSHIKRRGL
jgi:hypothetical protein